MLTLEDRQTLDAARRIKARERREAKAKRPAPVIPTSAGQRQPRVRDKSYLAWLHEGLPCIACLIEGPAPRFYPISLLPYQNPIEAAHQKHTDLKGAALGKRPSDAASCPLCAYHHRLAPDACDPAQRKFWDRLGVNVGDFCKALYTAFKDDQYGAEVIRKFVPRSSGEMDI